MKKSLKFILVVLIFNLYACASISEVKQEDRDLRNSYDGDWVAKHQTTNRYQEYGQGVFKCNQATIPILLWIEDSSIKVFVNHSYWAPLNLKEAYISSIGSFKTVLPTGFKSKGSLPSDITDTKIHLIIEGSLTPEGHGTGSITRGWGTLASRGCRTKLIFTKE